MDIIEALRTRAWKSAWDTRHADVKSAFEHALIAIQAPGFQRAEIAKRANGTLTDKGISDELRTILAKNTIPRLNKDRVALKQARDALNEQRAALGRVKVDPTDFAAALRRQEARQLVKAMPLKDQVALLLASDQRLLVEAVLEMPAIFSGLPQQEWERVQTQYVETHFAPQLASLNERGEVLDGVNVALTCARDKIAAESGLHGNQAFSWMDSIAA